MGSAASAAGEIPCARVVSISSRAVVSLTDPPERARAACAAESSNGFRPVSNSHSTTASE